MIRDFKLLLLGSCCLAVTACAAPNREPDLSNIKSNVDQTREGDFGDFLYNLVEAEDKAREASDIKASLDADAPYLYTNLPLRKKGVQLSEEGAGSPQEGRSCAEPDPRSDPRPPRLSRIAPRAAGCWPAEGVGLLRHRQPFAHHRRGSWQAGRRSATSSASIRSRTSRSTATPTRRVRPAPTRNWPVVVALRPSMP